MDLTLLSRPERLAQLALEDLAGRRARQCVDEIDRARRFVMGDPLACKADQSSAVTFVPGFLTTVGLTASPHVSSGTPITATSATAGWLNKALSTSAG